MRPKAVFLGLWDVPGKEPITLYNVEGGMLNHSTVTESTLKKEGIAIPKKQGSDERGPQREGGAGKLDTE
jgi:hypothetical protein